MASLNKVMLIGHLGKDPEIISFDNGTKKMSVTLATSERYRDRNGEWAEQTDWHNLVAWRGLAQTIEKFVHKGDKLYVEGELRYRDYEGQDGVKRRMSEIYLDKMEMLTPRAEGKPLPPDPGVPQQSQNPETKAPVPPAQQQMNFSAGPEDVLPF